MDEDENEPLLTEGQLQMIMDGLWDDFLAPQAVEDGDAPVHIENAWAEIMVQYRIMVGLPEPSDQDNS